MNQASPMAGGVSHGPGVAVGTQGAPLRAAAAPILFRRMPFWNVECRSETEKHSQRLKKCLQERMPSRVVEAIWNVTAAQLSPDPVRIAVMECTDSDDSKRAAALKARMQRRGDGLDDPAVADDDIAAAINQCLSTCDRSRRGSAEPWTEQEDRQLLHAFWLSLVDPTAPLRSAVIGSGRGAHAIELHPRASVQKGRPPRPRQPRLS